MLHLASLDSMPAEPSDAPTATDTGDRFEQLLAQAERLHRSGRQRFALLAIDQLAEMVEGEDNPSLEALFEVICLRKRVVLAMNQR